MDTWLSYAGPGWVPGIKFRLHERPAEIGFDRGSVYIVRFGSGLLKVGHTRQAGDRVRHIAYQARVHDVSVTNAWISMPHYNAWASEEALVGLCANLGTPHHSTEHFRGIEFRTALDLALQLSAQRPGEVARFADLEQRREDADHRLAQLALILAPVVTKTTAKAA